MPNPDSSARQLAPVGDGLSGVLDAVRLKGASSRLELTRSTGLTKAVVADRLQELIARGLISEEGMAPSTGGRPPRQLRFLAEAGQLLVADLGATSIDVARTDLAGRVLEHRAEPADVTAGPQKILDRVTALFDEMFEPHGGGPLLGIGIGVPGPVEFRTGRPVSPPIMPGWDHYPIRERFEAHFDAPVWVDNDVNLMVLGEWRWGGARGHDNVVFVKVGTGIGAGLISDGTLHRGAQGSAGDVGHIQVVDDASVICRCGFVGCLEAVAGGAALARDAEAGARSGRSARLLGVLEAKGSLSAVDVGEAAAHGDGLSIELLQRSGRLVGSMLAGVVNLFNPSLIVIGGGVAATGDVLLASMREVIYGRSLPLATRELTIKRSTLGGDAGILGAAVMVADQLFSEDRLARWEPELAIVAGGSVRG